MVELVSRSEASRPVDGPIAHTAVSNETPRDPSRWSRLSSSSTSSRSTAPSAMSSVTTPIASSATRHAALIRSISAGDLTRRIGFVSGTALTILASVDRFRASTVSAQVRCSTATLPSGPNPFTTRSKSSSPSSVSLTTTKSPGTPVGMSNSATIRGSTNTGSWPGRKKAPHTQPWVYEMLPNVGNRRRAPVRYSRSPDGGQNRRSTPCSTIRSPSTRRRSAYTAGSKAAMAPT